MSSFPCDPMLLVGWMVVIQGCLARQGSISDGKPNSCLRSAMKIKALLKDSSSSRVSSVDRPTKQAKEVIVEFSAMSRSAWRCFGLMFIIHSHFQASQVHPANY